MSPWIDYTLPPKEVKLAAVEAQTHRRFVKTHLPVDALVYSPKAKYLYIGRDGRDVLWSLYNHHANGSEAMYNGLNDRPGRVKSLDGVIDFPAARAAAGSQRPRLNRRDPFPSHSSLQGRRRRWR
jgi:hypothetical protein